MPKACTATYPWSPIPSPKINTHTKHNLNNKQQKGRENTYIYQIIQNTHTKLTNPGLELQEGSDLLPLHTYTHTRAHTHTGAGVVEGGEVE